MTQSDSLELAKQGDPRAIAALMNQTLNGQGITVRAILHNGVLKIALQSKRIPAQHKLAPALQKALNRLAPNSIQTVSLYGMQDGSPIPAWAETFDLSPVFPPDPEPAPPVEVREPILDPVVEPVSVLPADAIPEPVIVLDPEVEDPNGFLADLELPVVQELALLLGVPQSLLDSRHADLEQAIWLQVESLSSEDFDLETASLPSLKALGVSLRLRQISQMDQDQLLTMLSLHEQE